MEKVAHKKEQQSMQGVGLFIALLVLFVIALTGGILVASEAI